MPGRGPRKPQLASHQIGPPKLQAPLPVVDNNRKVVGALSVVGEKFVELGESFPTHIFLQNVASIQQRTSLVKFLVRKSFSVVVRQQAERLVMITETAADQIPCAKVSIATLHSKVQNCERTAQSASGAKWMPSPLNRLLRCFHIGWDDRRYQLIRSS